MIPTRSRRLLASDAEGIAFVAGAHDLDPAWTGFQHAHRALSRELERALVERHGLSLSALELLGRIAAQNDRRRRLSRLAGDVGLSLSRVSRLVDGLERRGLVRRVPCPADTRATNAEITDAGMALLHEAQATHVADVQQHFLDRLDAQERAVLARAFGKLVA